MVVGPVTSVPAAMVAPETPASLTAAVTLVNLTTPGWAEVSTALAPTPCCLCGARDPGNPGRSGGSRHPSAPMATPVTAARHRQPQRHKEQKQGHQANLWQSQWRMESAGSQIPPKAAQVRETKIKNCDTAPPTGNQKKESPLITNLLNC